ncbi:MAG: diaminopimelate decarboxylase [Canibacter sp.]
MTNSMWAILPEESAVNAAGELTIGGVSVRQLAETYGTPLHVIDETGLRRQMRRFSEGLRSRYPNSEVLFASKSLPIVAVYRIAAEEGLSIDVAGAGEIQLALAAGVDPARMFLHGNAKTDAEIQMALAAGVGTIIVDNIDEIRRLERYVTRQIDVLLRVIPGVEAKTHASQATGGDSSKFGLPLGQAAAALEMMRANPLLRVRGIHLHIGSQILDAAQFGEAVERIAAVGRFDTYDVGGGLGVKYTYAEEAPTVDEYLDTIVASARQYLPHDARIIIEPGRALVARAGISLYRVVSVKDTGAYFVAVDGGMADQLDIALTGQRYEAYAVSRLHDETTRTAKLVGRQCESGDLLVDGADLPEMNVDDLVAVAVTGAYSYTLTNNYNGALRPAVVLVKDGEAKTAVRRETYEDLLRLHVPETEGQAQ